MTTLIRGRTSPLTVEWFEYPGGPLTPVSNVIITITPLAGGSAIIGPTATGITNPSTGINVYQWTVSNTQDIGSYLVVWQGEDIGMSPVQASETINVVSVDAGQTSGPCTTWTPIWCCDLLDSAAVTGTALQAATEVLYALSGRQFDACTIELWPCRRNCFGDNWAFGNSWYEWSGGLTYPQPALVGGAWFNITCGSCLGECSCTFLSQVKLPVPVISIDEVRLDGEVLVPNVDYRLDDGQFLTRLGGNQWPFCNDMSQTSGVGTWSVIATYGKTVPTLGQMAVGELACEFAKACTGNDDCRLPKPVQQLTRQGVSMSFLDPNEVFANGRVGLYFSDLFISTVNPKALPQPSRVYNLDEPSHHRLGS
jgi:hypothetical protein